MIELRQHGTLQRSGFQTERWKRNVSQLVSVTFKAIFRGESSTTREYFSSQVQEALYRLAQNRAARSTEVDLATVHSNFATVLGGKQYAVVLIHFLQANFLLSKRVVAILSGVATLQLQTTV